MRLIDADAFKAYMRNALEQTRDAYTDKGEWAETITEQFCIDIDEQPTIKAQPERTGKWIYDGDCYICDKCGTTYSWWADSQTSNYCPNCGAWMKEGE